MRKYEVNHRLSTAYHPQTSGQFEGEFNSDFHPMVDFIAASPLRIETTDKETHILATVDGIQRTVSESSLRCNLKLRDEDGIVSIPDTELFEKLTLMGQYSRRAKIAQSFALLTIADELASPMRDVSEGEACPTDSGFIADQERATIAKSSTLPYDSAPRVTSPAADEGSMQHNIFELMALCTSLQRQYSELQAKFQAQEEEIQQFLAGGIDVPTGSGFIPTAGPPVTVISTGSEVGPTASLIVTRRKGKEVMVESDTPKKKKLQEQIDAHVARELEEQQEKENIRMNE
nr:hypothetical protein [Tanacetum cinerariifolium]